MFDIRQIVKSYTKFLPAGICFFYVSLYGMIIGGNTFYTSLNDTNVNATYTTATNDTFNFGLIVPSTQIVEEKRAFVKIALVIAIAALTLLSGFMGLTRKKVRDDSAMWGRRIGRASFFALAFFVFTLAFDEPWKSFDFTESQMLGGVISVVIFIIGSATGIITDKDKITGNPITDTLGPVLESVIPKIDADGKEDDSGVGDVAKSP